MQTYNRDIFVFRIRPCGTIFSNVDFSRCSLSASNVKFPQMYCVIMHTRLCDKHTPPTPYSRILPCHATFIASYSCLHSVDKAEYNTYNVLLTGSCLQQEFEPGKLYTAPGCGPFLQNSVGKWASMVLVTGS